MESSPSPAYGAVLEWQLGSNALEGSNPSDSAPSSASRTSCWEAECVLGEGDGLAVGRLKLGSPIVPGGSRGSRFVVSQVPSSCLQ